MRQKLLFLLLAVLAAGVFVLPLRAQTATSPVTDGTLRRIRVPILMYHYVSPLPEDADDIRIDLTVEPDLFRAHLQYLSEAGYSTISLYELHDALLTGSRLPEKPVVLTFDDGYLDHYTQVFPLLQAHGFTATFFIITGLADANHPEHLSWAQIQTMAAAGMSIEAHSKSHSELDGRDYDFLVYEMLGSQESLAAHLSYIPRMFSYPVGRYDSATLRVGSEMQLWRAVTTQPGMLHTSDNQFELPRVRVHGGTNVSGFAYLLEGRWLGN